MMEFGRAREQQVTEDELSHADTIASLQNELLSSGVYESRRKMSSYDQNHYLIKRPQRLSSYRKIKNPQHSNSWSRKKALYRRGDSPNGIIASTKSPSSRDSEFVYNSLYASPLSLNITKSHARIGDSQKNMFLPTVTDSAECSPKESKNTNSSNLYNYSSKASSQMYSEQINQSTSIKSRVSSKMASLSSENSFNRNLPPHPENQLTPHRHSAFPRSNKVLTDKIFFNRNAYTLPQNNTYQRKLNCELFLLTEGVQETSFVESFSNAISNNSFSSNSESLESSTNKTMLPDKYIFFQKESSHKKNHSGCKPENFNYTGGVRPASGEDHSSFFPRASRHSANPLTHELIKNGRESISSKLSCSEANLQFFKAPVADSEVASLYTRQTHSKHESNSTFHYQAPNHLKQSSVNSRNSCNSRYTDDEDETSSSFESPSQPHYAQHSSCRSKLPQKPPAYSKILTHNAPENSSYSPINHFKTSSFKVFNPSMSLNNNQRSNNQTNKGACCQAYDTDHNLMNNDSTIMRSNPCLSVDQQYRNEPVNKSYENTVSQTFRYKNTYNDKESTTQKKKLSFFQNKFFHNRVENTRTQSYSINYQHYTLQQNAVGSFSKCSSCENLTKAKKRSIKENSYSKTKKTAGKTEDKLRLSLDKRVEIKNREKVQNSHNSPPHSPQNYNNRQSNAAEFMNQECNTKKKNHNYKVFFSQSPISSLRSSYQKLFGLLKSTTKGNYIERFQASTPVHRASNHDIPAMEPEDKRKQEGNLSDSKNSKKKLFLPSMKNPLKVPLLKSRSMMFIKSTLSDNATNDNTNNQLPLFYAFDADCQTSPKYIHQLSSCDWTVVSSNSDLEQMDPYLSLEELQCMVTKYLKEESSDFSDSSQSKEFVQQKPLLKKSLTGKSNSHSSNRSIRVSNSSQGTFINYLQTNSCNKNKDSDFEPLTLNSDSQTTLIDDLESDYPYSPEINHLTEAPVVMELGSAASVSDSEKCLQTTISHWLDYCHPAKKNVSPPQTAIQTITCQPVKNASSEAEIRLDASGLPIINCYDEKSSPLLLCMQPHPQKIDNILASAHFSSESRSFISGGGELFRFGGPASKLLNDEKLSIYNTPNINFGNYAKAAMQEYLNSNHLCSSTDSKKQRIIPLIKRPSSESDFAKARKDIRSQSSFEEKRRRFSNSESSSDFFLYTDNNHNVRRYDRKNEENGLSQESKIPRIFDNIDTYDRKLSRGMTFGDKTNSDESLINPFNAKLESFNRSKKVSWPDMGSSKAHSQYAEGNSDFLCYKKPVIQGSSLTRRCFTTTKTAIKRSTLLSPLIRQKTYTKRNIKKQTTYQLPQRVNMNTKSDLLKYFPSYYSMNPMTYKYADPSVKPTKPKSAYLMSRKLASFLNLKPNSSAQHQKSHSSENNFDILELYNYVYKEAIKESIFSDSFLVQNTAAPGYKSLESCLKDSCENTSSNLIIERFSDHYSNFQDVATAITGNTAYRKLTKGLKIDCLLIANTGNYEITPVSDAVLYVNPYKGALNIEVNRAVLLISLADIFELNRDRETIRNMINIFKKQRNELKPRSIYNANSTSGSMNSMNSVMSDPNYFEKKKLNFVVFFDLILFTQSYYGYPMAQVMYSKTVHRWKPRAHKPLNIIQAVVCASQENRFQKKKKVPSKLSTFQKKLKTIFKLK